MEYFAAPSSTRLGQVLTTDVHGFIVTGGLAPKGHAVPTPCKAPKGPEGKMDPVNSTQLIDVVRSPILY